MEPEHADRAAIELIRGEPLADEWPQAAMPQGTRVRVVQDPHWPGPWRQDFTGKISGLAAPEPVVHAAARDGELAYWVEFDEPQHDTSDDGPYRKAQIWDRYLQAM